MKIIILLSIILNLLLVTNNTKAQNQQNFLLGTIEQNNFIDSFEVKLVNYTIIASVVIDGKKYNFLIDTGASNCISKKTAKKLNLPPTSDSISIFGINNSKQNLPLHKLAKFKLGNTIFNGYYFLVTDNFFYDLLEIDGIIGSNSFKNLIIQFSSQNSQMKISDNISFFDLPNKTKKSKLKLSPYQLHPYINIKLNSCKKVIKHNLLFDTGSNNLYSISNQNLEKIKTVTKSKVLSKTNNLNTHGIYGLSHKDKTQSLLKISTIKINEYCIENIIAQSFYNPISSLGTKILCYGKITLDYKKKYFYFTPYSEIQKQNCTYNDTARYLLGINFSWENGDVIIISIWNNLKAQKSGLKTGMKIKKIGSLSIPNSSSPSIMKDIMNFNFNKKEIPITVELENGSTKVFVIK